ncbi:hypothetical protein A3C33_03065 [Candidatus Curtissbacteria bacterium RIFCSPHIGHO2_02_FULL_42_58]|nr:MAG: hypothetical protein A3C33_03065 [Candidatus Curtissbacteria bacterium RIFCSPHIGHO2_02_FULL_42_58]OGD97784.1 MAG: hypothetical protein A3E71_03575 [Candidatus Curtissbacteria bacterium RIFCSPHIGHO2_12_FULL_42_33]OGE02102.1 MAG: hypothetical protein A3G16_00430 [Candidatus Curtissbacteria bacterium RIFCSPLOWO2_12_FULL_41_16]
MPAHKLPLKNFDWTSNFAYAVGVLATDGSLSKDGRHISLTSAEKEMLRLLAKCLNLKNKLSKNPMSGYSKNQAWRIQFGNVQLYNFLLQIGLSPNKTYSLGELKIPNEFFRDFLRGHLDGDGCIITYTDKYNTPKNPEYIYARLMTYFMSASKVHIQWLQNYIKDSLDIQGALLERKPKHKNHVTTWTLKFSKKESTKLLNWIYYSPSLPFLKRKYQKAKPYLYL